MPILSYFAVIGTALLALLFVADAKFERHGPLAISTNFEGLPKPWKPELNPPLPLAKPQEIQTAAAPTLDPKWNEGKPAEAAAVPQTAAPVQQLAKAEPPPKKKQKRAAHKQPRRNEYAQQNEYAQRYAWRHDGGNGWYNGNNNPWRF